MFKSPSELNFEFKLNPDLRHAIHLNWAKFYQQRSLWKKSIKNFTESHLLNEENFNPLLERSKCLLQDAKNEEAFNDIQKCYDLDKNNLKIQYQLIDCLYENNKFEESLKQTFDTLYKNKKLLNYQKCFERFMMIRGGLDQLIGEKSGKCLFNKRKQIEKIEKLNNNKNEKIKTLWKICKEKNLCDTSSEYEIKSKTETLLTKSKRKKNKEMLNFLYLGNSVDDYDFLKSLTYDERLFLNQTPETCNKIKETLFDDIKKIEIWRDMLRTRQPIYVKIIQAFPSRKTFKEFSKITRFRKQKQIREIIFRQLDKIHKFINNDQFSNAQLLIKNIITEYYPILTVKEFPRKFEFTNELCNISSILHIQKIKIPLDLMENEQNERIFRLFNFPKEKQQSEFFKKDNKQFGDRKAFFRANSTIKDESFIQYKNKIEQYRYLSSIAQYDIEKCYLYYEQARLHLKQTKYNDVTRSSEKVIEFSKKSGNRLYEYLGWYMSIRSDIFQKDHKKINEKLQIMLEISKSIDENVQKFTKVAIELNENDLIEKEKIQKKLLEQLEKDEEIRRKKREILLRPSII